MPSTHNDLCPHFGQCGGCRHQDLSYAQQLAKKADDLAALFQPYWQKPIPITASPVIWHYRNKVEFNFDRKYYETPPPRDFVRESVLGFKRLGKWYWTLDLETCLIAPQGCAELLQSVRHWMQTHDVRAHTRKPADGALRHLVVREASHTNQRLVILITSAEPIDTAPFVEAVLRAYPADSIYHGIYHGRADAAIADELHLLHGKPDIDEELHIPTEHEARKLIFRISPFAFFQTNTLATEKLYGQLRQWIAQTPTDTLYDLYGGAGGIALSCADLVSNIISVEEAEAATLDGLANAARNDVTNIQFITRDVRRYLQAMRDGQDAFTPGATVVLDPPRSGLHPKALSHLVHLAPTNVLYVSCNPKILANELGNWTYHYDLLDLQAVDLFPHTPHVEVLARLRLKA